MTACWGRVGDVWSESVLVSGLYGEGWGGEWGGHTLLHTHPLSATTPIQRIRNSLHINLSHDLWDLHNTLVVRPSKPSPHLRHRIVSQVGSVEARMLHKDIDARAACR